MDDTTSVQVNVPLKHFGACCKVVYNEDEAMADHVGPVFIFRQERPESKNFVLHKPAHGLKPLLAVHKDHRLLAAYGLAGPSGLIEQDIASRPSVSQDEFKVADLLRFRPDMSALEIGVQVETIRLAELPNGFLQIPPGDIDAVLSVPGELRDIVKSLVRSEHVGFRS